MVDLLGIKKLNGIYILIFFIIPILSMNVGAVDSTISLVKISETETGGDAFDVWVDETLDIAYVTSGYAGFRIFDIADLSAPILLSHVPESPALISTGHSTGFAHQLFVKDRIAYIGDGPSGLTIINCSDPNNPNGTHIVFGENDGLLIPFELGMFENSEDFQAGFGKYSVGGWFYTADFEDLTEVDSNGNPILRKNNFGLYLSAEKILFAEANDPMQGLAAFLRFGIANSNINGLEHYWGTGINITGLIRGRNEDVLGLAIGTARAGKKLIQINEESGLTTDENEMIIEFTYMFQATPWLRIQPDLQYVINPLGAYVNDKATIAGIRVEVAL
jgi:hypothetical protein